MFIASRLSLIIPAILLFHGLTAEAAGTKYFTNYSSYKIEVTLVAKDDKETVEIAPGETRSIRFLGDHQERVAKTETITFFMGGSPIVKTDKDGINRNTQFFYFESGRVKMSPLGPLERLWEKKEKKEKREADRKIEKEMSEIAAKEPAPVLKETTKK